MALSRSRGALLKNDEYDTFTANISSTNVAGPNRGLGIGAPAQTRSDVAMGTNGSMTVFRSDISGKRRIMVQPLDLNGNPITPGPILLATGAELERAGRSVDRMEWQPLSGDLGGC